MSILRSAAVMAFCAGCAAAAPTILHVAVDGTAKGPGTAAAPYATLEQARDAIRAMQPRPAGGVTVMVHAGTYELTQSFALTAADSGTAEAPVVYQAVPGDEVRLSGGQDVPTDALRAVDEDDVLKRLDPAARGQVLQADVKALGVDLGQFPPRYRGAPAVPELFFNDQRMTLARWPNEGWTHIKSILDQGAVPRNNDKSKQGGIFEYDGDRPSRWDVDAGVWLLGYWCFDWFEETIRIKAIDTEKLTIELAEPTVYGVRQGNPSPRRFCALNVLEELDSPGEYYLDRANGRLYFWPPSSPAGQRLALSTLNAPLVALNGCSHVTLRGFTLEAGLDNGLNVSDGTQDAIEACVVRNFRNKGIAVNGGDRHRVEACDIHDTGTGGMTLAGGDRKTLTPAGHEALNNHIWDYAKLQLTYASAIHISGVGNLAAHNRLHGGPHMAVGISGNDHLFEYNVIYDACTASDDAGAFYKGRDPSMRGNVLRYNFWYDIGSPMGHGNAAVYFDDGDGGETVYGNVFFRCGEPGRGSFGTVFSHGGHDLTAENNIFIECRRALGSSPWNAKRWQTMLEAALWQERLLKTVDITSPTYTAHYPELVGYMHPDPEVPRVNRAKKNVFVMCGEVSSGNWQWSEDDNLVTNDDPGFVDLNHGDFRLKPGCEVFQKIRGFVPPPVEDMGLQVSALRPRVPARRWTDAPPKPLPPPDNRRAGGAKPAPRRGPAPVFSCSPSTAAIKVDGALDEWPTKDAKATMPLAFNYTGEKSKRTSSAWLCYDAGKLYLGLDNSIDPSTKLASNQWGTSDAIEVTVRVPGGKHPISVIRGYGNGRLEFGTTDVGSVEPKTMDPGGTTYACTRPAEDHWLAEFAIPFEMLGFDPAKTPKVMFNISVRKVQDNLWLQWAPTASNTYNVDNGGLLEFGK